MQYTHNLVPTPLPAWLDFDGRTWDAHYLSQEQLAAQGWLPLVQDPEGALLGYADPIEETRDGHLVAVAYALATPEQEAEHRLALLRANAHTLRSAERLRRQTASFCHDGHRYASDREESIPLLTAACIGAQLALSQGAEAAATFGAAMGGGWRDTEGVPRVSTAMGILALHAAFTAHGSACDVASQAIKAEIDSAETIEALEAIVSAIPTDSRWPV